MTKKRESLSCERSEYSLEESVGSEKDDSQRMGGVLKEAGVHLNTYIYQFMSYWVECELDVSLLLSGKPSTMSTCAQLPV